MRKAVLIVGCLILFVVISGSQLIPEKSTFIRESVGLYRLFNKIQHGLCYCYSNNSKTTGFFVSKDGWILTAGHKVDKDFPGTEPIYVKLNRFPDNNEIFKSVEIAPSPDGWDLLLFKIDYKPKYYFKDFKKPNLFEENWVFGFRLASNIVPSGLGYVTDCPAWPRLLLTTAGVYSGNSGSPVINRKGRVLGILVMTTHIDDGLFISSVIIEEYMKDTFEKEAEKAQ